MTYLEWIAIWGIAWKAFVIGATLAGSRWWYHTKRTNPYL